MRSLADFFEGGARRVLERMARVLAVAALLWLLIRSIGYGPVDRIERVGATDLGRALLRWSTTAPPSRVQVRIDGDVSPTERDWLTAIASTGAAISWRNDGVMATAAIAEAVADPAGATRVQVAAPRGTMIRLHDAYGPLDSVAAGTVGASFMARSAPASVRVGAGAVPARAAVPDSLSLGRILVFGRVGWESKFVIAALEEEGWRVDARLALSPKGDVAQGGAALDTARYAAVVVLDSAGFRSGPAVVAYVRAGGGAIITAEGARAAGLGGLGGVAFGRPVPPVEPFDTMAVPARVSLGLSPVVLTGEFVVLEQRGKQPAVVARRVERGRILLMGYEDSWRWRMAGGRDALERHRAWWADLISRVAYVSRIPRPRMPNVDEAPLVHLIEAFGPPSPDTAEQRPAGKIPDAAIFAALLTLLLLEWASRRLRGDS